MGLFINPPRKFDIWEDPESELVNPYNKLDVKWFWGPIGHPADPLSTSTLILSIKMSGHFCSVKKPIWVLADALWWSWLPCFTYWMSFIAVGLVVAP